jgi:formylglycine-generating enzyme required for sulfatase activity/energy-coupling factor transporter ATP-binding protein EcfA2
MEPILTGIISSVIGSVLYEPVKGSYPIIFGEYSRNFQKARKEALKTVKAKYSKQEFEKAFFCSHYLDVLLSFEEEDRKNLISMLKDGTLPENDDQSLDLLVAQAENYWKPPQVEFDRNIAKGIIKEFFEIFYKNLKTDHELFSYIADCEQKARHEILADHHALILSKLDELLVLHRPAEDEEVSEPLEIPERYKQWVIDRAEDIDYRLLLEGQRIPKIELPEIFIPLYANPLMQKNLEKNIEDLNLSVESYIILKNADIRTIGELVLKTETEMSKIKDFGSKILNEIKEILASMDLSLGMNKPVDIEKLIANNEYLLIEGQAGSGKTTLIKHLAHSIIRENNPFGYKGYLPVLIFLKDLQDFVHSGGRRGASRSTAVDFLTAYLKDNGLEFNVVKRYCREGRVLFLVDGLDEIDWKTRDLIVDSLADFRIQHKCRMVFTGRPHGIRGSINSRFSGKHTGILTLNQKQIEEFIRKWFSYFFSAGSKVADDEAQAMINDIRSNPSVEMLTETPLMLTAMCVLYHEGRQLPEQRAELYKKFVDNLICKKFGDKEEVSGFLINLAFKVHKARERNFDLDLAYEVMNEVFPQQTSETVPQHKIIRKKKFEEIELNCGLLKKMEDGRYFFWHLTFQAFLVAVYIADYDEDIETYWEDEWYKEVVKLYIGYKSIYVRGKANKIILKKLSQPDIPPFYSWLLAGRSFLDIHHARREKSAVEKAQECMQQIFKLERDPKIKAEAGEILGWLDDPRDLKAFVSIEGGEYILKAEDEKDPSTTLTLPSFEIGKYPVTNQWYREFVDARAYENKDWWIPNGWKWKEEKKVTYPGYWHDRKWKCPNAPVVGVSWYEAVAFCRWLTETRNDGYIYRLPNENEWQAAAAGKDGREYPWGNWEDGRCNYKGSGIDKTSTVGIFLEGNTPEGVADLAGNVWEWTSTDFNSKKEPGDFDPDQWGPVFRGGSWGVNQAGARCASRYFSFPTYRYFNLGFRCLRKKM